MIWVATKGGTVRHPVNHAPYNGEEEGAKQLLCRERPLWVHVCSEEEIETLRPCYKCKQIINEEALKDNLMREC